MIAGLEILNLHAQGGMAEVYRARGKGSDGRTWHYAVKRILPELTADAQLRQMFVEEARVASLLVHPSIVRVYDLARSEDNDYFIVMEFLEGRDLADAIDRAIDLGRTIPVWMAIHVAREVLAALTYATTQATDREGRPLALIHRDISPHNIFVCFDGQVKLTDFGVAKVAQSSVHTQVGVTKGKFGYMSPEQLLSEKLDFRSDLYNVGILLYETITCRRLFFGENPSQFLQAMLRAEVPKLDPALRVPPELDRLMRRALSRNRDERPASPQAFADELGAIAERYGLTATREHIAAELRGVFGSEIESCPVPQHDAPKRLASISAALPEVVQRAEVPHVKPAPRVPTNRVPADPTPSQVRGDAQIFPPQQRARGLSDPFVEVSNAPPTTENLPRDPRRVPSNPHGSAAPSSSSAPRGLTRQVRALPEPGEAAATATIPRDRQADRGTARGTDVKLPRRGRLASADGEDPATVPPDSRGPYADPSTIPPDSATPAMGATQLPPVRASSRKATVIVGGGGAKPLPSPGADQDEDDAWGDATGLASNDGLAQRSSVVTRSPRVVALPDPKK